MVVVARKMEEKMASYETTPERAYACATRQRLIMSNQIWIMPVSATATSSFFSGTRPQMLYETV